MRKILERGFGALVLAAALLPRAGVAAQEPAADPSWEVLGEKAGDGEQCLVCGNAIHEGQVREFRYKGRTFWVSEKMVGEFEADPDAYFKKIQARAALFDEGSMPERQISGFWLGFGLYVLIGLLAAALSGYLAVGKGLEVRPWFAAGLLLNVFAVVAVALKPRAAVDLPAGIPGGLAKVPVTRQPASCPHCGAPNHPAAAVCASCGGALQPNVEPETARI